MKNNDKLWEQYAASKDPGIKEKLIIEYASLVKFVAGRLSSHIGQYVEYDDLISYGIFGLIDAIDKFDIDKGVKFETYASLRIRGAIIDNIRKLDWVPRTLRQKNKQIEQVYNELENKLGRQPTDSEFAEKLGIPFSELHDNLRKSSIVSLISLDDYLEQNNESNKSIASNRRNDNPEFHYEHVELKNLLSEAIDKLSEKAKKVITLYYFEGLTIKEISRIMGVTESRISQIHSKAVFKLQAKLGNHKSLLYGL